MLLLCQMWTPTHLAWVTQLATAALARLRGFSVSAEPPAIATAGGRRGSWSGSWNSLPPESPRAQLEELIAGCQQSPSEGALPWSSNLSAPAALKKMTAIVTRISAGGDEAYAACREAKQLLDESPQPAQARLKKVDLSLKPEPLGSKERNRPISCRGWGPSKDEKTRKTK